MERRKVYTGLRFNADAIVEASKEFRGLVADDVTIITRQLWIEYPREELQFDSAPEFFTEYRRGIYSNVSYLIGSAEQRLDVTVFEWNTSVTVSDNDRANIDQIFEVFERHVPNAQVYKREPKPFVVFIGHGHNAMWKDLKDHLHEQHGYVVESYEIGARAGHTIRDVLQQMMDKSTFALIVMTAEDETSDGDLRARQNVIHEAGLFQGKLGFSKCIAIVEEGVEVFSNLEGIHQIRFGQGRIKETYGEVLATLRRESTSG
jgi:predicted nucleotide-binding protein